MSDNVIRPRLGRNVYIADTAYVGGDITIGDDATIMHHVTIRGDVAAIRVGPRVNVQDGSIVHTKKGVPLEIGEDTSIGHRAVVHCRRVGRGALVGIGAILLDDAEIEDGAIVGAGALVPPGTIIPAGQLALGVPSRVVRAVSPEEREYVLRVSQSYVSIGRRHAGGLFPNWSA
jgi:carbonic anhydrase/acetyltransferase-like protein (isoleucine patch superfamily)